MKHVLKILTAVTIVLIAVRAILLGIDFLYKKCGNHYIEASND